MSDTPSHPLSKSLGFMMHRLPLLVCLAAGLALFSFLGNANQGYIATRSLFVWWGTQWLDPASELQHAWLLLALAVWLFVRRLRRSPDERQDPEAERRFHLISTGVVCAAVMLHGLGFQMQQARVSLVALLLFFWGFAGLWGGRRWSRAALFPLGLMLFAVPAGFFDAASFWLRLWVVEASQSLLGLVGVEVLRSGTQLFDPSGAYQYDVVAACSGVRSLQAVLALTLVFAHLRLVSNKARALVLLSSLPLVYLGNLLRILLVVISGGLWGQHFGEKVHLWSGLPLFALVLGAVVLLVAWLRKLRPEWAAQEDSAPACGIRPTQTIPRAVSWLMAGCILLCTLHVGGWCLRVLRAGPTPASGLRLSADGINPVDLPAFLGSSWAGRRLEPDSVERSILPPDTGYSRRMYYFLEDPAKHVFVSVVLSGRDRSSIHRPELCLVGQGWTIREGRRVELSLRGVGDGRLPVTLLSVRRTLPGGKVAEPELVAYFFVGAQSIVPDSLSRLWSDALSRVSGSPQRWAYILVQTGASDGEKAALSRLEEVLQEALPPMMDSAKAF